MDLWQCHAVVTGAASGLGAETARHLAKAGAKVTAIDIDAVRVGVVGDAIGGLAIPCDVSDAAAAEAAFQRARDVHGAARILVNSVGLAHQQRHRIALRNVGHQRQQFMSNAVTNVARVGVRRIVEHRQPHGRAQLLGFLTAQRKDRPAYAGGPALDE